jgi:hypothetical protein
LANPTNWTYKHFWTHEERPYALLRRQRELAVPGKTNDRRQIAHHAEAHSFRIERFERHGQHPAMFYGVGPLFLLATFYEKMIIKLRVLRLALH